MSDILVDGIPLANAAAVTPGAHQDDDQFWASTRRPLDSSATEVLEVDLGAIRSLNLLSFEVGRFPCVLSVQYLDDVTWRDFWSAPQPLAAVLSGGMTDHRSLSEFQHPPVEPKRLSLGITDSVPAIVDRSIGTSNPQHFGDTHWVAEEWKTLPVRTSKIRFLLQRNPRGVGPTDPRGFAVDFSMALRRIKVGYRIDGESDFDSSVTEGDTFASSHDILDSEVLYSIYRQTADRAVDGTETTAWRSDPQPVNYAVVPFYVDVRDDNGDAQVIDRWYVDPLTLGVHCNIYWSADEPDGDFLGGHGEVPYQMRGETGQPGISESEIDFGPDAVTGVTVVEQYLHLDLASPWWVGVDGVSLTGTDDEQIRPLLAVGPIAVFQDQGVIHLYSEPGVRLGGVTLPDEHVTGSDFRLVLAYQPPGIFDQNGHLRLYFDAPGYFYQADLDSITTLSGLAEVRFGRCPSTGWSAQNTHASNLGIRGAVVKVDLITDEIRAWFMEEGQGYVVDDLTFVAAQRNANLNAVLRIHPTWVTDTNPFGVVGGDGGRIESNIWHPIPRDYTLRRGWMEHPPVKAKYFKFEFTELSPQIFETFLTINRLVRCFPLAVVSDYLQSGPTQTREYSPHGTSTMISGSFDGHTYIEALRSLRFSGFDVSPETTSVLVANQPQQADQAADTGWIWQYQPWHGSTTTPRWSRVSRHFYEVIPVRHRSKVAFFVGLKELRPGITNFTAPHNTPEYVDEFYSDGMMEDVSGWEQDEAGFRAASASAVLTSKVMSALDPIEHIQFATVQTNPVQVLDDPDFEDMTLDAYRPYGDSTPEWVEDGTVRLKRFFVPITNLVIEHLSYEDMERYTYAELEGSSLGSVDVFTGPPAPLIDEISPGSADHSTPTTIRPHQFSQNLGLSVHETVTIPDDYTPDVDPRTVDALAVAESIRWYNLVFPASGTITIDTYLTSLGDGSWPDVTKQVWAGIYVDPAFTTSDRYRKVGKSRLTVTGTSGAVVTFGVYISSHLTEDATANVRVRTSSLNDTTQWDPYARPLPPYSEGGLVTRKPYSPMGAGEVTAKVRLTTNAALHQPILVEVIGAESGEVLASSSHQVATVGTTEISTAFTPVQFTDAEIHTYEEIEALFDTDPPDPEDPAAQYEVGPGSVLADQPKQIYPHATSTSDFNSSVNWLYYTIIPVTSGLFSIDTYLSTPDTGTPPHWETNVQVLSGFTDYDTFVSGNKQRIVGSVLAGDEIVVRVRALNNTSGVLTPEPSEVVVRTSDVGDISLWVPEDFEPPTETTYGFLEDFTYGELESSAYGEREPVLVRLRQQGITDDEFFVHQMALYDDPIAWSFSVDGGQTFYRAPKIRNNPHAVLSLPVPGNLLCWRVESAREDVWVSSLRVRPWYAPDHCPRPSLHDAASTGPNDSGWDNYPRVARHPLWILPEDPVHIRPVTPATGLGSVSQFWRNLVVNPGGEGEYVDLFDVEGGVVRPQIESDPSEDA